MFVRVRVVVGLLGVLFGLGRLWLWLFGCSVVGADGELGWFVVESMIIEVCGWCSSMF